MSPAEAGAAFTKLVEIMARLRAPDGCPWDREQDLKSLARFVLEEAAEVVDAIERNDPDGLREEVGDLIFEGVFLAQVSQDEGGFDVAAALETVCAKLIRRHPHIFASEADLTPDQVKDQWDVIKAQEKAERGRAPASLLDGIPLAEPALSRARAICSRVAKVGFDWPTPEAVLEKPRSPCRHRVGRSGRDRRRDR
jgi:MazG family protein